MIRLKNVLVATDFSEPSNAALNYGRELARTFGAKLRVVHVIENVFATTVGVEGYFANLPELQYEIEESARKELDAAITDEDRRELNAEPVLLTSSTPALSIVSYAKESAADLLVMGTHGRGGLAHALMGSVAERVVRMAPCPVLTVRHPEHEFVFPDALVAVTRA
jgi:nucleotide-binding universal stress UspA family protein